MTGYPNREHKNADEAARRRALAALDHLTDEAVILGRLIKAGRADGDDTQRIASLTRDIIQHVSILGALREVREWDAVDRATSGGKPKEN